ncbi:MAG: hypothetical protein ACXW3C_13560 [Pyrinomonadaceae bacterium]
MKRVLFLLGFTVFGIAASAGVQAQQPDPSITATRVVGKVAEINASAGQFSLKTDAGSIVLVTITEKTTFDRMPPGETDRTKAIKTSLAELTVGDGVYARGYVAADRKSVPAQQVVVVSQSDIAKKQEAELAEWRRRGVSGIVSALNPTTKEVTISNRSLMGVVQAVIIPITDKVKLRRYPPDSIPKYSDAKPGKFEEMKVGDQVRALGDKSTDGTRLTAEEVVFGTFKIAGGTVTAIDTAANQITISDLQTKKPITIALKPDSVLRRFTAMMGGGMGGPGGGAGGGGAGGPARQGAGTQGAGAQSPPAQGPGAQGPGAQGAGGQGPRPGAPGANMADMIDRLPIIAISELKVGDMIIMSTLAGSDPAHLTAISLVTGIEPLLTMIAARQQTGGQPRPQNVDLNSNFGGMLGGIGGP